MAGQDLRLEFEQQQPSFVRTHCLPLPDQYIEPPSRKLIIAIRCIDSHGGLSVNSIGFNVTGKILFSASDDCRQVVLNNPRAVALKYGNCNAF